MKVEIVTIGEKEFHIVDDHGSGISEVVNANADKEKTNAKVVNANADNQKWSMLMQTKKQMIDNVTSKSKKCKYIDGIPNLCIMQDEVTELPHNFGYTMSYTGFDRDAHI